MTAGAFSSAFSDGFAVDSEEPVLGGSGLSAGEQAAVQAGFFGEDIWYDVSADNSGNAEGDYVITAAGDVQAVNGREALRQSLTRRIITDPEEWPTLPNFGVGAGRYVKAKNTAAVRAELESKIRAQFLRDPRVESVVLVTVWPLADGDGLKISVTVTPRGRLRAERPLSVQVEIR